MKCFRCKEEIKKNEPHFVIVDMENIDKENKRDYVHKTCWNVFLKQVGSVEESMGIIRGLKKYFVKQGVLPEEKYEITN